MIFFEVFGNFFRQIHIHLRTPYGKRYGIIRMLFARAEHGASDCRDGKHRKSLFRLFLHTFRSYFEY